MPSIQGVDLVQIESAAYEAALVPELWPTALEHIGAYGEAEGAVLFSVSDRSAQWTSSPGVYEHMRAFVEEGWAGRNSRMANGVRKGLHLEPRFVTEDDYYEPGEIHLDPLHQHFFLPRGLGYSAGTIVYLPAGEMLCLSLERRWARGPIPPAACRRLNAARSHLVRAATLATKLGMERTRTAVETLAQLGYPAAAISAQGRVLMANATFDIEDPRWTTRGLDRLALADRAADQLLTSSLVGIAEAGGVRSIPLRDARSGLVRDVLHLVPIRRAAHDIFSRAVAIVVVASSVDRAGNNALLQVLFDLTAAEAALARRLMMGETLEAVAISTGRSVVTLRNQLRSVLAKTGCHRQSELVRILSQLSV